MSILCFLLGRLFYKQGSQNWKDSNVHKNNHFSNIELKSEIMARKRNEILTPSDLNGFALWLEASSSYLLEMTLKITPKRHFSHNYSSLREFLEFSIFRFGWKKMLVVIICVFDKLGYTWPVEECNIGLKK